MEEPITTADEKDDRAAPQAGDAPRVPEPGRIILPQKNAGPSVLSASRRPAGEALEAANAAPQAPAAGNAPGIIERLKDIPQTIANALPDVPALHTFRGDVAQSIEEHNLSLAAIAQAQARREEAPQAKKTTLSAGLVIELGLGLLLIAGAAGILAFIYFRTRPVPSTPIVQAPFIYVDQKQNVVVDPNKAPGANMSILAQTAQNISLPVGLVEQVSLQIASTAPSGTEAMDTRRFFTLLTSQAPDSLVRSLSPQFVFGIHSFDGNRPFLICKADSYEQAFAGMLAWEYTMPQDLAPLFPYAPSGATSTSENSAILHSPFADAIIDNHDVRALRDAQGNLELLWSFVDRQTLVITTNASTLQEIISRLQKAPTITIPR